MVTNFNQSEVRKHCFLASYWLKFVTLPRQYRTLYLVNTHELDFVACYSLVYRLFPRLKQLKAQWDDILQKSEARNKDLEENNLTQKVSRKWI